LEGFKARFEFDSESGQHLSEVGTVCEIYDKDICCHARYTFDHEVIVKAGDYVELIDGQWFLIRNGEGSLIEGKWDRLE
jgi:hypothetical protein